MLLADKRSPDTRRAYAADLKDFFRTCYGTDPTPHVVHQFIGSSTPEIALRLAGYKSALLNLGRSEATINRRLAAVRSLLKFSYRLGLSQTDGSSLVDGEKARAYRDTRGVDLKTLKKLLLQPAKRHGEDTVRTHRDVALLTLLIENALRRAEVCKLDISDFEYMRSSLFVLGKGRGSQKERIDLSGFAAEALRTYLVESGRWGQPQGGNPQGGNPQGGSEGALFVNVDRRPEHAGRRLTPDGLYGLVGDYGRAVGLQRLTPHMLRHSAVTAALDMSNGDVRKVQKLSRHSQLSTLMIYDDNRQNFQGEMSNLLSGLLQNKKRK
jgi:integrase/recombinase XerC